jgi:hypothetical protein
MLKIRAALVWLAALLALTATAGTAERLPAGFV